MRARLLLFLVLPVPLFALPPDAAALKARRDVKLAELNASYVRALERCKTRAISDGDVAGASEIEQEIDAATMLPLATSLISGTWVYALPDGQSTPLKFHKDGTAIDTKTGKLLWKEWRVVGESLVVTFPDGNTCTFAFNGSREGVVPGITENGLKRTLRPKLGNAG